MATITIGNTSFDQDAIKKVPFEQFEKEHKGKIYAPGKTLREVYDLAQGKKPGEKSPGHLPEKTKIVAPEEKKVEKPEEVKKPEPPKV